ncbi:MAG: mechanosensitive ion channel [Candidatus Latescibacterota bacterium]|nr:MAG: mechanosensitive ion channel [Candidatus Latescibacterota bacterium]
MTRIDRILRKRRNGSRGATRVAMLLALLLAMLSSSLVAQEKRADNKTAPVDSAPADTIPPDLARAHEILGQLDAVFDTLLVIEKRLIGKNDEEFEILRVRAQRELESIEGIQAELLKLIPKLEQSGLETDEIRKRFLDILITEMDLCERSLKWWAQELDDLREARASTEPQQLDELESRIAEARSKLDGILGFQAETLTTADSLAIDTGREWQRLERTLKERAEMLVGRLQIAVNARDQLEKKVHDMDRASAPADKLGEERARFQVAKRRVEGVAESLEHTADMLGARGFETAQYRQFIIKTTGEITERILDPKVLIGLVSDLFKDMWEWIKDNAPTFFVKLLILLIFIIVFRVAFRLAWWLLRIVGLARLSRLMTDLVGRMINPFASLLGLISGLWFLGVNPTTLLAGLGVAGIIVGLALQDSLSNLASGFFILVTRPFDVDDTIMGGGVLGTVKEMGLANTTIVTFDGRRLMVPNRKIWGDVIENRSAEPVRRVEITVRVSYTEDLDNALDILHDLCKNDERVLATPEPLIFVSNLDDSWVEIDVRPWVRNRDWWPMLTDLPRLVRLRFAKEGIEIPYPRTEFSTPGDRSPDSISPDRDQKK